VCRDPAPVCVSRAVRWIGESGSPRVVACLNPHSAVAADRDPEFFEALSSADLLLPDGVGVVAASRLLGAPVAGRVTGSDFFEGLSSAMDAEGGRSCFFLGSAPGTLGLIERRAAARWPRLRVAGVLSPRFSERFSAEEEAAMVAAVNAARADVLWVGMTAPKQEKWIHRNRRALRVPIVAAIGAVFDFFAGTVPRPHPALRRLGLEWAGRLLREPRRVWRRTLVSGPRFATLVLRDLALSGRPEP
jgi:N-acetylglucosaminyldiphosphoundecaprenol N-acetyl-beta-D-mannosaminyltransferase